MAACAIENNVPQVGREQILLGREMHWVRMDRYFAGEVDNPQVTFQPMMCQQCTHAPCEAVCPVIATSHDPEGINSMTYNRCIGTRYCANACPYKVRRFNWWTHKWGVMGDRPQDRMPRALNPEVTVRTRGVMEKCNFCVQRVRQAKYSAKERGGLVRDGEVLTACAQVCPSDAITFGNLKDQGSRVSMERRDPRSYLALGGDPDKHEFGIKTLPNVSYMAVVAHRAPLGTGVSEDHGAGHGSGHEAPAGHEAAPPAGDHHG
jgi:molybdopterin-containing oxidoreductase family iron-sulfur binding subunit